MDKSRDILRRIKELSEDVHDLGMARSVMSAASPSISDSSLYDEQAEAADIVFQKFVTEIEIIEACEDLFFSGHYNIAVSNAVKAVDVYIKSRVPESSKSGTSLMNEVFSSGNPVLKWSSRRTQSERDQHDGYRFLFAGIMLGMRNPTTHEFGWIDDAEEALECILFAQHLLKKAKLASDEP